jgi:VCBS repeat-containing protein
VVIVTGDGVDDATVTFRGPLAALNAALDGITYTPDLHYNSGNPNAVRVIPGYALSPDVLTVTINDLGNTDILTPPDNTNPNVATRLITSETVHITVSPIQDGPTLDVSAAHRSVDEDSTVTLGPIVPGDVDAQFDPAWRGQVTLVAGNGVLTVPGYGLQGSTVTFQGSFAELTAALAAIRYTPNPGYNSGNPHTGNVVPDQMLVTFTDIVDGVIGTHVPFDPATDPPAGSLDPAVATVLVTVGPKNDPPTVDVSNVLGTQLDEDTPTVLAAIVVDDPDAADDPLWQGQVTLSVVNGTLTLPPGAVGDLVFVVGDGMNDATVRFRGSLSALNAALAAVTYTSNLHWNSGNPNAVGVVPGYALTPDVLTATINDLGNTDLLTAPGNTNPNIATALSDTATVDIIVRPIQDDPSVNASGAQGAVVDEDGSVVLGPILIDDVDAVYDPLWRGQVTLTAVNGQLSLPEEVRTRPLVERVDLGDSDTAYVVYVIDISISTTATFGGSPVGDVNNDGRENTVLDAQIAGFLELNNQLVNQFGANAYVSVVWFDNTAGAMDMDPVTAGVQLLTGAHVDADGNDERDVEEVLRSLRFGGGTSFQAALQETINVLQAVDIDPAIANVVFISDGASPGGFDQEAATVRTLANNVRAFGAGTGARLDQLQIIDPNAEIFTTTDELLLAFGGGVVIGGSSLKLEGRTGVDGSIRVEPENGEGGPRDEFFAVNRRGLVEVDGGRLVHTTGLNDSTQWSIAVENGGLMIDLGAIYTIDVMQIWNFNATGLEQYGPTSFDLWISSDGTDLPADTSGMTQVLNDVPLNRATVASDPARYFGETYLFGQATPELISPELHDEDGPTSLPLNMGGQPLTVTARFLYLGDLTGTSDANGHVGLSEVQFYVRPPGSPALGFVQGDGTRNSTLTIEGSVDDLNAALAGIQYFPNPDYNSGNPAAGNVLPDIVRVAVSDLGNTGTPLDPADARFAWDDISIVVNPKQDQPGIELSTPAMMIDEDVESPLAPIVVTDVDYQLPVSTIGPALDNVISTADRILDPNWAGELTLSVEHGTLRLTEELIARLLPLPADGVTLTAEGRNADGSGSLGAATEAVNGGGLTLDASGQLVHSTSSADAWLLSQEHGGLMIDLGAEYNIDVLQIWNYNVEGQEAYGPQSFDLWVAGGNTLPGSTGGMTRLLDNQLLTRQFQGNSEYLGQTYFFSAANTNSIPAEVGDQDGSPTDHGAIALRGRYLFIGDLQGQPGSGRVGLSEVRVYGRPVTSPNITPLEGSIHGGDRTLRLRGSMADLNNLLDGQYGSVMYLPDLDYNSGNPNAVPPNVVPDQLVITINDLGNTDIDAPIGNTDPALGITGTAVMDIDVHPIQDGPTIDVSNAHRTVDENGTVTLGPIVVADVDAPYDPAWRGELTLEPDNGILTLPVHMRTQFLPIPAVNDAIIDGTLPDNPSASIPPVGGEGGPRDENHVLDGSGLSLVDVDGDPDTPPQWVHAIGVNDFTKWRVGGDSSGLLIDLGSLRSLDVVQMWNFNGDGLESFGADEFDVYISSSAARPSSMGDLTLVRAGLPLAEATGGAQYLGETFVFGGAGENIIPAELGDQTGSPTLVPERLTGRWMFLVLRNASGSESVGLSELRFYGRPGTAPTVEYIEGDGLEDRRITIRGNLEELNAALAAVTYQLDPGYNSGNPQAGNVVPDRVLVTLTDHVDGVIGTHVPVDPGTLPTQPSTVTETVLVTVLPKNDPPTVDLSGALGAVLDEDTSLVLGPIALGDPDEPDDPLWQGQVTLSVSHGTLTLPDALTIGQLPLDTPAALAATNADGSGSLASDPGRPLSALFDGSGLALDAVSGRLIHRSDESGGPIAWSVAQETAGVLIDLGASYRVDVLQLWNFNAAGLESYGTSQFDLWMGDDPAALIRVLDNEPLARAVPGDANYLGQTFLFSGATLPIVPVELGDESGGVTNHSGIPLYTRYLFLGDLRGTPGVGRVGLSEIQLYGRDPAEEQLVFLNGNGIDVRTVTFRGTMQALNAALDGITYTPDPDYNSGNPNVPASMAPEQLVVTINDLGNTDILTPPGNTNPSLGLTATETLQITVHPIQDAPTLSVAGADRSVDEDGTVLLGQIVVGDIDAARDPAWLGEVTLTAGNGVLSVPSYGLEGSTVTFRGGMAALNAALAAIRYTPNPDYNSGNPLADNVVPDEVHVTFTDVVDGVIGTHVPVDPTTPPPAGSTAPATGTVRVTVNPKNDLPTVDASAALGAMLDEDQSLVLGTIVVGDLDEVDDPLWQGQVTLSVVNGTVTLPAGAVGGLVFVAGDGVDDATVTFRGPLAALNAALDGITYTPNPNCNSGNPDAVPPNVVPDIVTVTINDLGNTDILTPAGNTDPNVGTALTATAAIGITVQPTQDAPQIVQQPQNQTISENAPPLLLPFTVFDVDARSHAVMGSGTLIYDPAWIGRVTVEVDHGTLTLPPTSMPSLTFFDDNGDLISWEEVLAGSFGKLEFQGLLDHLNAALAGLRYTVNPEYNSGHPSGVVTPDSLRLKIDDLGNTGTPDGALTDQATVAITVRPVNTAPEILLPAELLTVVDEDAASGLLLVGAGGTGIEVHDIDDAYEPVDIDLQLTVSVQHGGLVMDLTGLQVINQIQAGANEAGVDAYRSLTVRGTIAQLNAALAALRYYGNQDFNTGSLPELLVIEVNDLGNSDYRAVLNALDPDPVWALSDVRTIPLTVLPINDPPEIFFALPGGSTAAYVVEDSATGVLLVDAGGAGIRVDDLDDIHDPRVIPLLVTLTAAHGGMVLGSAQGVTVVGATPAYNPPTDLNEPVIPGTSQVIQLRGTIANLNQVLATLRFFPDQHFNSEHQGHATVTVHVNDLGNTDKDTPPGNLDPTVATRNEAERVLSIYVGGINDPPTISLPPAQTVLESSPLVFSAANVPANAILVDDPDVLETPGGQLRVTLSVSHGTLTLNDVAGLTFPLDINGDGFSNDANNNGVIDEEEVVGIGFRRINLFGSPDDVNAALDGMFYRSLPNYYGMDHLVIVVSDQGFTGSGGELVASATLPITVVAVNTPPWVDLDNVPVNADGWAEGYEDTNLPLPGIRVGDPDRLPHPVTGALTQEVTVEVTLQVTQGTLTVNTAVSGGINVANGNGTGTVVLIGTPTRINQTLAHPTGLVYRGNPNYNDYSSDHDATPNEVLWVTVNDRGNVGLDGALQDSASLTISILPVNDPPGIATSTQKNLSEDAQNAFVPMVVQDLDADENPKDALAAVTVTLRLTDAQGQPLTTVGTLEVSENVAGGIQHGGNGRILGNGTAALTISGSPVAITNTFAATGGVHYLPAADWHGSLRLVATVEDHGNTDYRTNAPSLSHTVTVTINVTAVNDPPSALPQTAETLEDQAADITLTGNDGDPEVVQVLTFKLVDEPTYGTLTGFNSATGAVTYTPGADFNGTDTFTFTVTDDHRAGSPSSLTSTPATVTINVIPVNKPPVANPQEVETLEDQPATIVLTGEDSDPEVEQVLTFTITTPPQHGTLGPVDPATGAVVYTPDPDFNGTDSFAFTVTDDASAGQPANLTSEPATVLITVIPVNKPPVADPQTVMTDMGAATLITLTGDDGDPEVAQVLTFAVLDGPSHGTLSNFDPLAGTVMYTPNPDFAGSDTFTFTVTDDDQAGAPPNLTSASETVTINVTLGNRSPVAHPQSVTTPEDLAKVITLTGDDGNPEVVQGLTFAIVSGPTAGTLTGFDPATGLVTYTPHPDFNGSDSFTFTVTDDDQAGDPANLTSQPATVSIVVTPVNKAPVADPQAVTTAEGTAQLIFLTGEDGDPEVDQALTFTVTKPPQFGTLGPINQTTGAVTYTPNANFNGQDSFEFTVTDDAQAGPPTNLTSPPATVSIIVTPVNARPVAHPQDVMTAEETAKVITLTGDDGDPEVNQVLTFTITTPPQFGTLGAINQATGAVTYTPDPDFNGTDSFAFTVTDDDQAGPPHGLTSPAAVVTITVTQVNKPPVAHPQSVATGIGTPRVITLTGDDSDPEVTQVLTFAITTPPQHGTLSSINQATGVVTYTPNAGYVGADSFAFAVTDDALAGPPANLISAAATVAITVRLLNEAPVARPEGYTTDESTPLVVAAAGVLANDTDADADTLTAVLVSGPSYGALTLNPNGSFVYTPLDYYNGTDRFTYKANDGQLDSNVTTVTITVDAVNDLPILDDNRGTTNQDQPMTFMASQLLGNARPGPIAPEGTEDDESGQTLSVFGVSSFSEQGGTVIFNTSTGLITYTPPEGFAGTDHFTYMVTDDGTPAAQVEGKFHVTVVSTTFSTSHNTPVTLGLTTSSGNDAPVGEGEEGEPPLLVADGFGTPMFGKLSLQGNYVVYTPEAGYVGEDSFTYTVTTGEPQSTFTGTIHVTMVQGDWALYHNPLNPYDVNGDGNVTPLDALVLINHINQHGSGPLLPGTRGLSYLDVLGDGNAAPQDVLLVINQLNRMAALGEPGGEGEADGPSSVVNGQWAVGGGQWPVDSGPLTVSGGTLSGDRGQSDDLLRDAYRVGSGDSGVTDDDLESLYDDVEPDLWDLEDALSDLAAELDDAAQRSAADRLFASL